MNTYYPIFIKLKAKKCVVIGGGNVALRKIHTLLEYGANIKVISPIVCEQLNELAAKKKVTISMRKYRKGDLKGAFIAVVATDDKDINGKIAEEAYGEKVLLNIVDNPDMSNYIVPSSINRGDLTVAVSTGGKSPALARKIKAKLEGEIGEEYAELVEIVDAIRTGLKTEVSKIDGEDWQKAVDLDVLIHLIKNGEREKAKTVLLDNLTKCLNK